MSRSKKDKKGGHSWGGYGRENGVIQRLTRRRRRQAGKVEAHNPQDEDKITPPEKSTGGWLTW